MTTTIPDQPAHRPEEPEEIDESSFVRYVIASLGVAGVGLGAVLARRRPIVGGGLIAGGVALIARGVRGQWPSMPWRTVPSGANEGEGSRTAARAYDDQLREFIDDGRVGPAARAAAVAVEGPEGPSLRAAEAKGKTSPTNGH